MSIQGARVAQPARLSCSDCSTANKLRGDLREAHEELAEWRRLDKSRNLDAANHVEIDAIRTLIGLPAGPSRLLLDLYRHEGVLRTKDQLYAAVVGEEGVTQIKVLDVQICKLRAALAARLPSVKIETVWGMGYRLPSASGAALGVAMGWRLPPELAPGRASGPKSISPKLAAEERGVLLSRMSDETAAALLGRSLTWVRDGREMAA
jgi:hypothetical protein